MIICVSKMRLSLGANAPAVMRERMRLSRQSFNRGLAGDFRPSAQGGPRRLLPLVGQGEQAGQGRWQVWHGYTVTRFCDRGAAQRFADRADGVVVDSRV